MVPWLQVYANLTAHPKTYALAERLKLTSACTSGPIMAAGMVVGVWLWAVVNATDGDLTKCSAMAIADAAGWKKKPDDFRKALVETGWIDSDGVTFCLHDWDEYVGLLMDKEETRKSKTRDRVRNYRERKKDGNETPCNGYNSVTGNADGAVHETVGNADETRCNAPTKPNLTVPNQGQETGGVNARAREALEFYEQTSGCLASADLQQEVTARIGGNDMELVKEALRLSARKQRPGKYFAKCLQNWRAEGILDYTAYCAKYRTGSAFGAAGRHGPEKTFAEIAAGLEAAT